MRVKFLDQGNNERSPWQYTQQCIFAPFQGFFEEIEDIKYALQQAAKLNKVYEKTLRKMCMQFGVPYPNPENTVQYRR